jgi:hypothetical protein
LPLIIKKNPHFGGSCVLFIDEFRPFYRPKFHTIRHPLFSLTGSSFPSGIPNNTDILLEYGKKAKEKLNKKKEISDIRTFAEKQEEVEQIALQSEFDEIDEENNLL